MSSTHPPITRRRVDIDFSASPAHRWHGSRKDIETFLNAISFFFPAGERFFIESVQHYQGRITDPALREQVKRFIYQEAMHTKEHARCNHALETAHPYGPRIAKISEFLLMGARRAMPKATQLGITCAIEHFTAIFADRLLSRQNEFIARTDPALAALWMWHAVEETEHKAVCFDVYRHVFGKSPFGYLNRILSMAWTSFWFVLASLIAVALIRKGAKRSKTQQDQGASTRGPRSITRYFWNLMTNSVSLRLYLDYYKPGFHPWNHDNAHLVDEWKRRFPNFGSNPDTADEDHVGTIQANGTSEAETVADPNIGNRATKRSANARLNQTPND